MKMADFRYTLQRNVSKVQAPASLIPDRDAMEKFLGMCHRRRYPNKTAIIRPGDSANILYYVIDGSLTVSSEDEEGRELILAYLNRGEFIGEMGLFVETPRREVMVRTRTPCELAEIGYERLFNLFEGPCRIRKAPRSAFRARKSAALSAARARWSDACLSSWKSRA